MSILYFCRSISRNDRNRCDVCKFEINVPNLTFRCIEQQHRRLTTGVCVLPPPPPKVFKEEKYLKEAVECGEVIWQRGLLRKGYGICHGTAGNGYAFLSLYKLTQEKKYLYRACKVTNGSKLPFRIWTCLCTINTHWKKTKQKPFVKIIKRTHEHSKQPYMAK